MFANGIQLTLVAWINNLNITKMTEKEFNEIKSLIIGLGGITEFKSTADRVDNALSILDRNKQLMLGGVSNTFNSEEEILSFIYRNIPIAIKPKRKSKFDLINPFTSNNAFEEVCKGISKKLYKKLFDVC